MANFCAECGVAVKPSAKFCSECGSVLSPKPVSADQVARINAEHLDAAPQSASEIPSEPPSGRGDNFAATSEDPSADYFYTPDAISESPLANLALALAAHDAGLDGQPLAQISFDWIDLDHEIVQMVSDAVTHAWLTSCGSRGQRAGNHENLSGRGWKVIVFEGPGSCMPGRGFGDSPGFLLLGSVERGGARYLRVMSWVGTVHPDLDIYSELVESCSRRMREARSSLEAMQDTTRIGQIAELVIRLSGYTQQQPNTWPALAEWTLRKVESFYLAYSGLGKGAKSEILSGSQQWTPGLLDDPEMLLDPFISSMTSNLAAFPGLRARRIAGATSFFTEGTSLMAGWEFPMDHELASMGPLGEPNPAIDIFGARALMSLKNFFGFGNSLGVITAWTKEFHGFPSCLEARIEELVED